MKEINLEEILLSTVPKDCYWGEMGNLTNCPKEYVLDAMKEACKQVLELAVENVSKVEFIETGPLDESVIENITNIINQVK